MRKSDTALVWGFTIVLVLCCLFLVWLVPTRSNLDFQLADIEKSLNTSHGRERKQQYEYDEVVAELPRVRAELAQTQPLADEAAADVAELKAKRKTLRAEKEALQTLLESQNTQAAAESLQPGSSSADADFPSGSEAEKNPEGGNDE